MILGVFDFIGFFSWNWLVILAWMVFQNWHLDFYPCRDGIAKSSKGGCFSSVSLARC